MATYTPAIRPLLDVAGCNAVLDKAGFETVVPHWSWECRIVAGLQGTSPVDTCAATKSVTIGAFPAGHYVLRLGFGQSSEYPAACIVGLVPASALVGNFLTNMVQSSGTTSYTVMNAYTVDCVGTLQRELLLYGNNTANYSASDWETVTGIRPVAVYTGQYKSGGPTEGAFAEPQLVSFYSDGVTQLALVVACVQNTTTAASFYLKARIYSKSLWDSR